MPLCYTFHVKEEARSEITGMSITLRLLKWRLYCLVLKFITCPKIPLAQSCLAQINQSCERTLTTGFHIPSPGHQHGHSHTRPRSRLIRCTQTRYSRLHVLLLAFFQNGNSRLRRLVRPSIAEPRGSRASIARPLEATSKLSFV
jgi:hypothetical protein